MARGEERSVSFDNKRLDIAVSHIQDRARLHPCPLERARIDHPRRTGAMLLGLVRMAVKQEIKMAAVFDVAKESGVVTVNPGNLAAAQLKVAERFVQRGANFLHG